ncbi:MAG: hypothetical protein HFH92_16095 [Lachnospiraceae bacterium]|nr:hypothetical protein [uncultured Acetatifactor sp.]MCI8790581.1 hypothetical protein [Lachnospiraceae bacterium]
MYISHKLSFCRFCDRILVLDQGELVQSGSHDELAGDLEGAMRGCGRHRHNITADFHHFL